MIDSDQLTLDEVLTHQAIVLDEPAASMSKAAVDAQTKASAVRFDREVSQAREELRGKVAVLAIAGAEKVLGTSIDAASHNDMLDKLAAEL